MKNAPSAKKSIWKNMCSSKSQKLIVFNIILLVFGSSAVFSQKTINKSPTLEYFFQQVENEYIPQKWKSQLNWGVDSIAKIIPYFYVKITGYAMFKQKQYLEQNPSDTEAFNSLNEELLSKIPQIVNEYNKANYRNINFEYHDPEKLKEDYIKASNGGLSDEFRQKYIKHSGKNITQINAPYVFDKEQEITGIKKARRNAIVLLGQEAPRVEEEFSQTIEKKYRGPEQIPGGCQCPLTVPTKFKEKGSFYLDCNGNKYDADYVYCIYSNKGYIVYERPYINGKQHGLERRWMWDDDYPKGHYLSAETEYANGEMHGIYQFWYVDAAGRRYLHGKGQHKNGQLHGTLNYYNRHGQKTDSREYVNGTQVRTPN